MSQLSQPASGICNEWENNLRNSYYMETKTKPNIRRHVVLPSFKALYLITRYAAPCQHGAQYILVFFVSIYVISRNFSIQLMKHTHVKVRLGYLRETHLFLWLDGVYMAQVFDFLITCQGFQNVAECIIHRCYWKLLPIVFASWEFK